MKRKKYMSLKTKKLLYEILPTNNKELLRIDSLLKEIL
jgi:hypothetical protein